MIVLGLDTSTAATAVALRVAAGECSEQRDDPPAGAHPGHATRLLAMADALLRARGLGWESLQRIAAGVGPGRFTGLRVGLASARGLAHSLSCELVGVSSLEALASAALAAGEHEAAAADGVLALIDARRGEVFAAAYQRGEPEQREPHGSALTGESGIADASELVSARALAPQEIGDLLAQTGERRWLALGDGALRYAPELERAGIAVANAGSHLHRVSACAVCELGARAAGGEREPLLPRYLREPDAELALRGARAPRASSRLRPGRRA